MTRLTSIAVLFVALGAAAAAAQAPAPSAPASPPAGQQPDPAEAARLAERARLDASFRQLEADLHAASAVYNTRVQDLQKRQVAREHWPPHPNATFYARFEELAQQDQPDALRWCLGSLGQIGLPIGEVLERKLEIYARLVVVHPDLAWMSETARWLQADAAPGALGFQRADELLRELAAGTSVGATRAAALGARWALLAARTDPESRAEALKVLEELAAKHADTPHGAQAKGRLFQVRSLAPGAVPPDVEAIDVEGAPLKLSDYRGKVLVLEFWGFW